MNNGNDISPDTIMKENVHNESSTNEDSVLLRDTTVTAKQRDMDDTSKPYRNQSQHQKQNPMQPLPFQSRCQSYPLAIAKVDDDLLHRAIADAGRWAFGTIYVELWALNDSRTHLFRPPEGWWLDPSVPTNCKESCSMCRLTDKSHPQFVPPLPLAPGIGLPGVLWAELEAIAPRRQGNNPNPSQVGSLTHSSGSRHRKPIVVTEPAAAAAALSINHESGESHERREATNRYDEWKREQDEEHQQQQSPNTHQQAGNRILTYLTNNFSSDSAFRTESIIPTQQRETKRIAWRRITDIANDPNQPHNERLQVLPRCDLDWAAAVPFEIQGQKGIVIYMARKSVNLKHLQSLTNEAYLKSASDLIGSAWALRGPRQAAVKARQLERDVTIRRARIKLISLIRMGISLEHLAEENPEFIANSSDFSHLKEQVSLLPRLVILREIIFLRLVSLAKKCRGSNTNAPPSFSWNQSMLSFWGVFLTFIMLTKTNEGLSPEMQFALPPFGALVTLQFGLTSAPASQPRNIMVGQAISISIAIALNSINELSSSLRISLTIALAVASMVKLGITHPPAGAAAVLFAMNPAISWINMGFLLIANVLAIFSATLINNLTEKRQYPSSWSLAFLRVPFDFIFSSTKEAKSQEETL